MREATGRATLLNVPLIEERYGNSFLASLGIHVGMVGIIVFGSYLLPGSTPVQLGSGLGGGVGGDAYTVGVADDLSGGTGMIKPSLEPKPPALLEEKAAKEAVKPKAMAMPDTIQPKKLPQTVKNQAAEPPAKAPAAPMNNVIPTSPQPGAGGTGGVAGGSGGGRGGGIGVSIGSGSGGLGDSWYARTVETRVSSNWIRPPAGITVEMIYSFYIAADGSIYGIRRIKSSGNPEMDLTAERAIRASNPLAPPPPEFRGRPIEFVAQFIHPPSP
jgi:TonB family protein